MLQIEIVRYWAIQSIMSCTDISLLDLLLKLLFLEGGTDHETP